MNKIKIMLFSGFLGSGKTTTMVETVKYLKDKGINAALITNDLGENLVDTAYSKMEGAQVSEISNGCLCHDIENFIGVVQDLYKKSSPDIIFAEPVGSCVDLVNNVYKVIDKSYSDRIELLPFTCVIDPSRYRSIYMKPENNTFNDEAVYMYKKQLEDGDILLLNKCDTISEAEKEEIIASLKEEFPHARIVPVTSLVQGNYEAWTAEFLNGQKPSLRKLDISYDYIKNANEHMGWYNNIIKLEGKTESDYNEIIDVLMKKIQSKSQEYEIAHLKIMGYDQGDFLKTALTSVKGKVFFSNRLKYKHKMLNCNINIRALMTPDRIARIVHASLKEICAEFDIKVSDAAEQAFDRSRPAPKAGRIDDLES